MSRTTNFVRGNQNGVSGGFLARTAGAEKFKPIRRVVEAVQAEPRWNLAFLGIVSVMFFEYTRLPEMYPILKPLELGKVLVVLTLAGFLTSAKLRAKTSSSARGIDFALLVFLGACLVATLLASDFGWLGLGGFVLMLVWAVDYFLLSRILATPWRLRFFMFLLLLLNLKLAQFVVRDYFMERAFGRSAEFLSVHGVGAGTTDYFGNSGDFGVAMVVAWPIAGALLFGEGKKIPRLFLWVCFVTFLVSIFLCGSRGAVLGAAGAAIAAWAKNPKRIAGVVMVLFFAFGSFWILPTGYRDRMTSALHYNQDATAQMRFNLWHAGMDMFERSPLVGVGVGNFGPSYLSEYGGRRLTPMVYVEHSIYVQALAETGLAGTLPLLATWFFFFRLNRQTRKRLKVLGLADRRSFEYRLSVGLDLAMVGYMVSGAFVTVLFYPHMWYLLGLSVALHTACIRKQVEAVPAKSSEQKQERTFALATS